MQPYQEASEESIRQAKAPQNALMSAAKTGLSIGVGGKIASRVLPFLNSFIPSETAIKGLEKIDPRFGKFINGALRQGHNADDTLKFIKDQIAPKESKKEAPKENRNIIEQYSPELFRFLKDHIDQGRSPIEAGALAQLDNKFKKSIAELINDHKAPFSAILETAFGPSQQQSKAVSQQPDQQKKPPTQQPGQGDAAILAALDKILKM